MNARIKKKNGDWNSGICRREDGFGPPSKCSKQEEPLFFEDIGDTESKIIVYSNLVALESKQNGGQNLRWSSTWLK